MPRFIKYFECVILLGVFIGLSIYIIAVPEGRTAGGDFIALIVGAVVASLVWFYLEIRKKPR